MRRPGRLRAALTRRFVLFSMIPVILAGTAVWQYLSASAEREMIYDSRVTAHAIARETGAWLQGIESILGQVAGFIRNAYIQDADGVNRLLDNAVADTGFFECIHILDHTGHISNIGLPPARRPRREDYLGLDMSHGELFIQLQRRHAAFWSDTFLSLINGKTTLTVSVPLLDKRWLIAHVNTVRMGDVLGAIQHRSHESAFIVDRNGNVVFQSGGSPVFANRNLKALVPVKAGMAGQEGSFPFDMEGVRFLGYVAGIPEIGWMVMAYQREDTAYANINRIGLIYLGGVLVTLLAAGLAAILTSRRLAAPFAVLGKAAGDIALGRFETALPRLPFDEIEAVGASFREMTRAIQAREADMARLAETLAGAWGEECFHRIAAETCRTLGADIAIVGRLTEAGSMAAVGMLADGEFIEGYRYPLADSPCERVVENGFCHYPENVAEQFPEDKELAKFGAESYIGVALQNADGRSIGILCALSRRPRVFSAGADTLLGILAARAAAEIERLDAEQALVESEARFRAAIEQAGDAVFLANAEGRLVDVNHQACRSLGYTRQELLSLRIQDVDPNYPDADKLTAFWRQLLPGRPVLFESAHRCKDGSLIPVEIRTGVISVGDDRLIMGVARDITERHRSEARLKASESKYRTVIAMATDGFWFTDTDGRLLEVNDAYCRLTGYSREALLAMRIPDVEALEDAQAVSAHIHRLLSEGWDRFETRHRCADGRVVDVEVTATVADVGAPNGFFCFIRDITEAKRSQEALRAGEERFRAIADYTADWENWISPDGRLLWTNPAVELITGYSRDEYMALGEKLEDRLPKVFEAEDLRRMQALLKDGLQHQRSGNDIPFRIRRRDGATAWVSMSYRPIYGEDGKYLGLRSSLRDINNRKRYEAAIERVAGRGAHLVGEAFLEEMVQQLADVLDADIAFIGECRADDPQRVDTRALWHQERLSANFSFFLEESPCVDMLGGDRSCYTVMPDTPAGHHGDLMARFGARAFVGVPLYNACDQVIGVMAAMYADTMASPELAESILKLFATRTAAEMERMSVAAALAETETSYRTLFSEMQDGLALHEMIHDADGHAVDYRFLAVNEAFERLVGMGARELVGKTVLEVLPGTEAYWISAYGEVVRTGETQRFENYSKDMGRYFEVVAFRPREGQFATIVTDVTRRRQLDAEKQELEERLRQARKMEAIGALAGGIAHDFNNILFPIAGYTELSMGEVPPDSAVRGYLGQVLKAARRAQDLVGQILAFSRQSAHERRPVTISTIAKEVIKLLTASLPSTIEIRRRIEARGMVMADPVEVHQVIMNLCTNAYHALRDRGGVLSVSLIEVTVGDGEAAGDAGPGPGRWAVLDIEDNGHGIPREIMDRIFDPYFTTKPAGEGTGMGLATVHGIVTSLGGAIQVSSTVGQGTRFRLSFPLMEANVAAAEEGAAAEVPRGSGRVLLVDDEEQICNMLKRMLTGLGYRVVAHTVSRSALGTFKQDPHGFDIVVTDMTMPRMTGLELAREIHTLNPAVPILMLTGYSEAVSLERLAAAGVRDLLMKPALKRDIAAAVSAALEDRNAAAAGGLYG